MPELNVRPLFRSPVIFQPFSRLIAAESTRHGGVSPAPFTSLNLGFHTPDIPAHIQENRRRFLSAIGSHPDQLAESHQIHGQEVLQVTEPGQHEGFDALITNRPGVLLGVKTADCTPVLLFDSAHQAVAAIHAGWRGTVARIVERTFARMSDTFGTRAKDCFAFIGTCIDECSYEVDADVAGHFLPAFRRWDDERQKFFLDLKSANRHQLINQGIPADQIGVSPFSTVIHNEDYFSYRHEKGRTGRQMAVIGLARIIQGIF